MEEEKHMSFLEHLEELRWRLVRAAIAVLVISSVLFVYQEWIMDNLFLSMKKPDFISFRLMCEWFGVCIDEIPVKMQSMTVGAPVTQGVNVAGMQG